MTIFYPYNGLDQQLNNHSDNYLIHFILPILTKTYRLKKVKTGENKLIMNHNESGSLLTVRIVNADKLLLLTKSTTFTITPNTKIITIMEYINKLI